MTITVSEDEARVALLRRATLSGKDGGMAEALFARTAFEDLEPLGPEVIGRIAADARAHLSLPRGARHHVELRDVAVEGRPEATIIEIVNDNMPFLFDSVMAELGERGLDVSLVAHPILAVKRGADGGLVAFAPAGPTAGDGFARESFIHVHVPRLDSADERTALVDGLDRVLADVRASVSDWQAMRRKVEAAVDALGRSPPPVPVDDIAEANQFLRWLLDNNFTFLGVREYRFATGDFERSEPVTGSGLGILADPSVLVLRRGAELVAMTPEVRAFLAEPTILIVTKANVKSRVHRRVHMDYVGVKLFGADGRLEGELRVVGLFTSTAYTRSVREIPYLRHKSESVLRAAGFDRDSHSGKALANVIETYPRDELFQVDLPTLKRFAGEILELYDRPRVRVLARRDRFDRFVAILVYVPRDRYDTEIRRRIGEYLAVAYQGRVSAAYPSLPEGPLVRVHFVIGRSGGATPDPTQADLERQVAAICATFADGLAAALTADRDGLRARLLVARYAEAFSAGYREAFGPAEALADIEVLETLAGDNTVAVRLSSSSGAGDRGLGLKVYSHGAPLALSQRVPILEQHGLTVSSERTWRIAPRALPAPPEVFLHDMVLEAAVAGPADASATVKARLEASLLAVLRGDAESDGYNALVLASDFVWRDVALMRALSRYLRQVRVPFSQDYLAATLVKNAGVAAEVRDLFRLRFDPATRLSGQERDEGAKAGLVRIEALLATVTSLDEDRILRRFVNLVEAMLRTNFWQRNDGSARPTIAFKFEAAKVDGLPVPRPLYEIFVYSPRVEGVHLRFGKVARGGLRWSDRPQDFRTEILGLVKAQQVKNAVIVPVGAKGGFVPKRLPAPQPREAWLAEGTESYRIFIGALLDLTDNLVDGAIVAPPDTVRRDADDPYLVVAADKGTATFSDTANAISLARGHWLGDAFASGGSQGYDHKKMGITARGAWEAVKRHFRELGTDIQATPFTAAGVGDMSGDVFGNAMMLSRATKLVAAFDHRDIFLDPTPDPVASHAERVRLFALPRSSWADYDKTLISSGGGVFPRSQKSISLSPQVQALLDLPRDQATPQDVMSAILRARVDLLFFGGIGTYIKASDETDDAVGDRANDAIRVSGREVRATVIGEGANLGLTQRGRIEAARGGVRLNTDAIDNSAGVNTSDVEVNIKIALTRPLADGRLTEASRNALLAEMTEDVAALVLANNHAQTLAITMTQRGGAAETAILKRLMQSLEGRGLLDRRVEDLPSDSDIDDRVARGEGLSRPEIAVLLAYAKISLFDDLIATPVPDAPRLASDLGRYFPGVLAGRFADVLQGHRLRREIIATQLANAMINRAGPGFMVRLQDETGAGLAALAQGYIAAREVFDLTALGSAVDGLDGRIEATAQAMLYDDIRETLLRATPWFARPGDAGGGLDATIETYKAGIGAVRMTLLAADAPALAARRAGLAAAGLPPDLSDSLASLALLGEAPDIVATGLAAGRSIPDTTATWLALEGMLQIGRLTVSRRDTAAPDRFERLALHRARSAIADAKRRLVGRLMSTGAAGGAAVAAWRATEPMAEAARTLIDDLANGPTSVARLTVAAAALADLA